MYSEGLDRNEGLGGGQIRKKRHRRGEKGKAQRGTSRSRPGHTQGERA